MNKIRSLNLLSLKEIPMWCAIDASSIKTSYANWFGKTLIDRSKRGVKKNIIIDQFGTSLALSAGLVNRHDFVFFKEIMNNLGLLKTKNMKIVTTYSAYDTNKLKEFACNHGFILYAATNRRLYACFQENWIF